MGNKLKTFGSVVLVISLIAAAVGVFVYYTQGITPENSLAFFAICFFVAVMFASGAAMIYLSKRMNELDLNALIRDADEDVPFRDEDNPKLVYTPEAHKEQDYRVYAKGQIARENAPEPLSFQEELELGKKQYMASHSERKPVERIIQNEPPVKEVKKKFDLKAALFPNVEKKSDAKKVHFGKPVNPLKTILEEEEGKLKLETELKFKH
jgi:hypothetical protein